MFKLSIIFLFIIYFIHCTIVLNAITTNNNNSSSNDNNNISYYYVDLNSSNNNNTNCGLTIKDACKTLPLAYQSFISNSNGSDITNQELVLYVNPGVYNAIDNAFGNNNLNIGIINISNNNNNNSNNVIFNGFNYDLPLFSYFITKNYSQSIVLNNIQFINSSYLITSTEPIQVDINNCTISNVSSSNAGLFYLNSSPYYLGAAITITNSKIENIELTVGSSFFSFTNYTVSLDNVLISNITGSYTMYNCNCTISNSILTDITSDKSPISSFGSDLYIDSTSFIANDANNGGAISFELLGSKSSNTLKISNSNFTNNYASSYGGSIFLSNTQKSVEFKNCIFSNNSGLSQGGAISAFNLNDLCINSCKFDNNISPTGGAIYFNQVSSNIINTQISNNNATKDGGALFVLASNITMNSVEFNDNSALEYGDNVDCITSSIDIIYSTLSGNFSGFYCPFGGCKISGLDFESGKCPGQNDTSSSATSSSSNESERNSNRKKLIIVVVCSIVGGIIVLGIIALIISFYRKNQINKIDESKYLLNS